MDKPTVIAHIHTRYHLARLCTMTETMRQHRLTDLCLALILQFADTAYSYRERKVAYQIILRHKNSMPRAKLYGSLHQHQQASWIR